MRASVASVVLAMLTACSTTEPVSVELVRHELDESERRQVEASILTSLGASAGLFSGVQAVTNARDAVVLCGWVRVKSEATEYPTFPNNRPFAASYSRTPSGISDFHLVHFAQEREQAGALYRHCGRFGISV